MSKSNYYPEELENMELTEMALKDSYIMTKKGYISKKEVATLFGKIPSTIVSWHNKGKFIADKITISNVGQSLWYLEDRVLEEVELRKIEKVQKDKITSNNDMDEKKAYAIRREKLLQRLNDSDTSIDVTALELAILSDIPAREISKLKYRGDIKPIGVRGKTDLYDSDLVKILTKVEPKTKTPQWVLDMRKERTEHDYVNDNYNMEPNDTKKEFVWRKTLM